MRTARRKTIEKRQAGEEFMRAHQWRRDRKGRWHKANSPRTFSKRQAMLMVGLIKEPSATPKPPDSRPFTNSMLTLSEIVTRQRSGSKKKAKALRGKAAQSANNRKRPRRIKAPRLVAEKHADISRYPVMKSIHAATRDVCVSDLEALRKPHMRLTLAIRQFHGHDCHPEILEKYQANEVY